MFALQDAFPIDVAIVVMVSIRRRPGQISINHRSDDLVNVMGAVFAICVFSIYKVSIEND